MKTPFQGVFPGVSATSFDQRLLALSLPLLMERLDQAVLLLDADRTLRYMSPAARELLGYDEGELTGGRCRMATRGTDCQDACPLSCALQSGTDLVPEFAAVYHTKDGRPVPVHVTIVVLRDERGQMQGAVEILSRREPELGFFAQGTTPAAARLREEVRTLASVNDTVIIVGEEPARYDVAWSIHRASGLEDGLFRHWKVDDERDLPWPPGTLYIEIDGHGAPLPAGGERGWRILAGADRVDGFQHRDGVRVLVLPSLAEREEDLPTMLKTWVSRLSGGRIDTTPEALDRLMSLARHGTLTDLRRILVTAVARARDRLEVADLRSAGAVPAMDDMLASEDPLMTMEACILEELLRRSNWKMQEVADRLGISRVTLWRKLREHGICKDS